MFCLNLFFFRRLGAPDKRKSLPPVSVLIPARIEENAIGEALMSVLGNTDVVLEVVVLDDNSTDNTAEVVKQLAKQDGRVRLHQSPVLPAGWNGKQHACYLLAQHARHDRICFLDADVRLAPDALVRMLNSMEQTGTALLSGFPRQITITFLERLLIPLIHFVLLGFLPIPGLKKTRHPAFAAGCGQLMLARREEYFQCGGHSAFRLSMHDGLRLPRAFREAGFSTDLFDATDIASVRMYTNARDVWFGLAKNAVEGLAAPGRLPVFTVLLVGGQVLPFLLMPFYLELWGTWAVLAGLTLLPRLIAAIRFRQPLDSALLHPVGITVLLVLQYYALVRHLLRRPSTWKGRNYVEAG
ncbi:MAG: glycosyltransferase [Bryobacteraceae bacterium]|nr:glycosyltransferase [Bryobacteraceae bacterium]